MRQDKHIQKTEKTAGHKEIYEEVSSNSQPITDIIYRAVGKERKSGDLSDNNFEYFMIQGSKLVRFYLLPKLHKRLKNLARWHVISKCGL